MAKQRRACDTCHKRKIQCDYAETNTPCNWCVHRGVSCTFARTRGRRKKKTAKKDALREAISERIENIENFFANRHKSDVNHNVVPQSSHVPIVNQNPEISDAGQQFGKPKGLSRDEGTPSVIPPQPKEAFSNRRRRSPGSIYFNGLYLGTVDPQNYAPLLSTEAKEVIFSATGEWPALDGPNDSAPNNRGSYPTFWSQQHESPRAKRTSLPETWVIQSLLNEYSSTETSRIFPIIHEALFQDTITKAYETRAETTSPSAIGARSCVFAFLAFAGTHLPRKKATSYIDVQGCALEAQALMPDFIEDASLTTLQTIMFLLLYHTISGRIPTAAALHSLGCHVLFALGGHTLDVAPLGPNPGVPEIMDLQLRKLFWLMYMFDKELTLRTGQPPKLSDEYCNLSTPSEQTNALAATSVSDNHGSYYSDPWVPGNPTLSILKSKIFRLLYSFDAFCKSETELLMSIRELDEELESWRQSVPAQRRPDLSASHTKALSAVRRDGETIHHMMHHLEYHHLMGIIHSASGRCRKAPGSTPDTNIIGLQSSLELSVQASRVSLAIIRAGAHQFPTQAFWVMIFYPVSAFMTLFFNVLRSPLHTEADNDTELLASMGSLIREMSGRQPWTGHEAGCLEGLCSFVVELCRLGRRAVEKARNESVVI